MKLHHLAACGIGLLLPAAVNAAVILNDSFNDGGRTNGDDPADAAWYRLWSEASGLTIDSGAGFTNALRVDPREGNRGIVAILPASVSLGTQVGDQLRFSFVTARFGSWVAHGSGFRFGLFHSGDTPITSDGSTAGNDDVGLVVGHSSGTQGTSALFYNDSSVGLNGLGTELAKNTTGQTYNLYSGSPVTRFVINLKRVETGVEITCYADLAENLGPSDLTDHTPRISWTGTIMTPLTFNEVYIGVADASIDFRVDDIVVETLPVPEPSAMMFLGGTLLALGGRGLARSR